MENPRDLSELQELIGYTFRNPELLRQALTTTSYANENPNSSDRTMTAFSTLGDAVINVVVIQSLMDKGLVSKGEITKGKVKLVKNAALPDLVERIQLIEFVRWGKGQKKQEHWNSDHLASDCLEVLMGAVYLDSDRKMNVVAEVYKTIEEFSS